MSLVPVDASSEVAITDYLTKARDWLATAVEKSTPMQIAGARAEIATAAEAAKQLGLSKEIQLDVEEMVRRSEYALGKSIRRGQAEGTIASPGQTHRRPGHDGRLQTRVSETFRNAQERAEVYRLADGVANEAFDSAVAEAKAEGNLSRANVIRKVKGQPSPVTRDQRADLISDLAGQGYTSRQMAERVGVLEGRVREIARAYDIEIPADKATRRTRSPESTQIATSTVSALDGLAMGVELIDYDALEPDPEWVASLTHSLQVLNRFARQIKEKVR